MEIKEANALVNRGMSVVLSCKTLPQLESAVKYADLIYRKINKEVGLINNTKFISLIERSIGYAQCKINYEIKPIKENN